VVKFAHRPLYCPEKTPVPTEQEALRDVSEKRKFLDFTGIRTPDRPDRSLVPIPTKLDRLIDDMMMMTTMMIIVWPVPAAQSVQAHYYANSYDTGLHFSMSPRGEGR
jgi:hypothetical protein